MQSAAHPSPNSNLEALISKHLRRTGWTVMPLTEGWSETAFVANHSDGTRVFLKLGGLVPALQRLAALGVIPPLLGAGDRERISYAIQPFVDAPVASHEWFAGHLPELAALISSYQQDPPLQRILEAGGRRPAGTEPQELEQWYGTLMRTLDAPDGLPEAFEEFRVHRPPTTRVAKLPTHGDMSRKNILLTPERVYLIDWDEVALADPMRDVGPLLWWYVPRSRWSEFFDYYAVRMGEKLVERMHWWVARVSLDVAFGLAKRGYGERAIDFIDDFIAAVNGRDNPHARHAP